MASKIGAKTANIDLTGFVPKSREQVIDGQSPGPTKTSDAAARGVKPHTGVGIVMESIAGRGEIARQLSDTQAELQSATSKLAEFDHASVAKPLDPKLIRRSRWANRNEAEFATDDFQNFKAELQTAGGNVQAIKVRAIRGAVIDGQSPIYEIVYGHRRHRGCLELGLSVNAIVVLEMSDKELFAEMDRENRGRKNLSAWEQGCMYNDAIKEGLYPSIRQLADANTVNLSDAVRWVQLAKLPKEVVDAFLSPLDLQVRWAKPLTDALQRDPDGVLSMARELQKQRGSIGSTEVFERLVGKPANTSNNEISITASGKKMASFRIGPKGRAVIEFEAGVLQESKHEALAKLIEGFLAQNPQDS